MRSPLTLAAAMALALSSAPAQAAPTTWLGLGIGGSLQYDNLDRRGVGTLSLSGQFGIGSDASRPIVVGGVFRALEAITLGMDYSLSARIATGGFARGEWGAAFDLGVALRPWASGAYGHFPLQAIAILGLVGGAQIEIGGDFGDVTGDSPIAKSGFALFSVDFFRMATKLAGAQRGIWSDPHEQVQVVEHTVEAPAAPPPR